MNVAILKYNAGNVQSVIYALQRLGVDPVLTDDRETLLKADKVIFPGQGEASNAMRYLRERELDKLLLEMTQPVLGICIGQQLMCRHSEEGNTDCLGIFDLAVKKFPPREKVPHMGWNRLDNLKGPLFERLPEDPFVYYVHSYYCETGPDTVAESNYILPFSAALQKDNYYAIQAHPEKSGKDGAIMLENFLSL
ncbi:imidazole glycerol phosphate synthase subunit HisH [Roseivirga sp. BDSF3-8]|uniref:imidazole glycerol phosphate synthase subunit HisH n=1 Tax=Roseivirga sp. BDSF3-8 TaxID=3241598 RepID=UPI003531F9C8